MFMGKGLKDMRDAVNKGAAKLKIDSGKSAEVRFLTPADEIISVYEHSVEVGGRWKTFTCLGKHDCPLCSTGDRASFKAYLALLDRTDGKVKYWKVGKRVALQLLNLFDEYGDLTKRDFKISRQGEKLDTTYQFFPRDPKEENLSGYELPNLAEMVEPMSREAIIAVLRGGAVSQSNEGHDVPQDMDAPPETGTGNSAGKDDDYPF